MACKYGSLVGVNWLVNHGGGIEMINQVKQSPLLLACSSEKDGLAKLQYLVQQNARVTARDSKGNTAMHFAASRNFKSENDADMWFDFLIKNGLSINETHKKGYSPLHLACRDGSLVGVKWLLSHGGKKDCWNDKGETPLLLACTSEVEAVGKLLCLVLHEADVRVKSARGSTAVHYAASRMSKLKEEVDDLFKYLVIEKELSVNKTNESGQNPLHLACGQGGIDEVKWLLAHGADIECKDKDGLTPLLATCCFKKITENDDALEKAKSLAESGASVKAKDYKNKNGLHHCAGQFSRAKVSNKSLILWLVEKGVEPDWKNDGGKRPYELATGETRKLLRDLYKEKTFTVLGEKVQVDSSKFCFIGDEMAGKTTMVNSILESNAGPIDPDVRTAGVDVHTGQLPGIGKGSTCAPQRSRSPFSVFKYNLHSCVEISGRERGNNGRKKVV